jgi:hypothetical protein
LELFGISIKEDFGYTIDVTIQNPLNMPLIIQCGWQKGSWELWELETVEEAITEIDEVLTGNFIHLMGQTDIKRVKIGWAGQHPYSNNNNVVLPNAVFYPYGNDTPAPEHVKYIVAHEYAHIWDWRNNYEISRRLQEETSEVDIIFTAWGPVEYLTRQEEPLTEYGYKSSKEDWAETFAAYIYPDYVMRLEGGRDIRMPDASIRWQFVVDEITL